MATITLRGETVTTVGNLPDVGATAPAFTVTDADFRDVSLADFAGKRVVLSFFPSIDTGLCAQSVRTFNKEVTKFENTVVISISKDLPFALSRFCGAEGIENVITTSAFRSSVGEEYGVTLKTGPTAGLLSRAVVVINEDGKVVYTEQVQEIGQEPNYDSALEILGA